LLRGAALIVRKAELTPGVDGSQQAARNTADHDPRVAFRQDGDPESGRDEPENGAAVLCLLNDPGGESRPTAQMQDVAVQPAPAGMRKEYKGLAGQ